MYKKSSILFCFLFFLSSAQVCLASDPPEPFNKSYLLQPQEHINVFGVDPDNPSDKIGLLTEILIAYSLGGTIVYWSDWGDYPVAINAHIPAPNGSADVLNLLYELRDVYGISDINNDLEVRIESTNVPNDSADYFPSSTFIYIQHVCRYPEETIDVVGSGFAATLNNEGVLTTLSSSYKPTVCPSLSGHIDTSQIQSMYPGISSSIEKALLPPGTVDSLQGTFVYQFIVNGDTFYEVRADTGAVVATRTKKLDAWNITRVVYDPDNSQQICVDTNPSGQYNTYGGAACVQSNNVSFKHMYDSLFWSILPWRGSLYLTSLLNKSVSWGSLPSSSSATMKVDYSQATSTHIDPLLGSGLGRYNGNQGGVIYFNKHVFDITAGGKSFTTLTVDNNGNPLPGLGGVVDLVAHEVGHGYIDAYLKAKHNYSGGYFPAYAGSYEIGRAISESLSDAFGKLAQIRARFDHVGCTPSYPGNRQLPIANCGEWSSIPCGSGTCARGEYCSNGTCKPCVEDCPSSSLLTMNWNLAETYTNGHQVFDNTGGMRSLTNSSQWKIVCPFESASTGDIQQYGNGSFFGGVLVSFNAATDPLFNNQSIIRNYAEVAIGELIVRHSISHMPKQPTAKAAFWIWASSLSEAIKYTLDSEWNQHKFNNAVQFVFQSGVDWKTSVGRCDINHPNYNNLCSQDPLNCCDPNSLYICRRPTP